MYEIQLVTDCEGPLALNDNAFELCRDFLRPGGDRFFLQVSRLDDYLADLAKREGYKAGTTLKLILPFLKAYGLTDAMMAEYSEKTLRLTPGAAEAYRFLLGRQFPIFEISTSYRQFAEAVGKRLGIGPDRIFCTELNLDRYKISKAEADKLRTIKDEIAALPEIVITPQAQKPEDLSSETREVIERLEYLFGEVIPEMDIGRIYAEVEPVGGQEKAKALEASLAITGKSLAEAMFVGDSITDVEAFKTLRAGGGVTVSFNGNRYAINSAEFIVVANNAWPIALLTVIFQRWGKDGVVELSTSGQAGHEKIVALPEAVIEPIVRGLGGRNFSFYAADVAHRDQIIKESEAMRARLRGQVVAALS
jgi:energy-converting hydrogenase A subunit R|uniref:phosphoserine phosphatase n=1 Tax=Desulfobacca acetoxidans TaxID=60893 RepID=A0A7C3SKA2_9BACT